MKIFLTIFIFFLAIMIQISFSYLFSFWQGNGPNPVLVLVLLLVILKGFGKNWWAIAALGLFMDFFSGLAFGTISFSLILCAFIIDWFNRKVFSEVKMETVASLIILGSLLYSFFLIGANALLSFIGRNETVSYFCYFKNCVFSSFPFLLAGLVANLLFGEIIFCFLKRKLSR
ncbi:hypothetical protein KKD72_01160 [Patescibacteria group bacterium]|nr:hypothetical protein [Patescibacteria group bacterium]